MIRIPEATLKLISQNPPPTKALSYQYGTAGFRYQNDLLPHIFVKMGILAALRSYSQQGEAVGLMCTASHNLEHDNGIKMADPDGGMLKSDIWEKYAVSLANAVSVKDVLHVLQQVLSALKESREMVPMRVHFGRDTRAHSPFLTSLAIAAANSLNENSNCTNQMVHIVDHGIVTTPQLHYFVMHANSHRLPNLIPFHHGRNGYFDSICHSYIALLNTKQSTTKSNQQEQRRTWNVDCACGVGSYQIQTLHKKLQELSIPSAAKFAVINGVGEGPLNDHCGAEFVQKQQKPPRFYSKVTTNSRLDQQLATFENNNLLQCSLDGDADRIVFHYHDDQRSFHLLDGDKIAVLVATFVQNELSHLIRFLRSVGGDVKDYNLRCGVVQTAYANGASTDYLKTITKTNVCIAKTGVKYVHTAAHSNYDIGIYFEANGHGTILFGPQFYQFISHAESQLLLKASSKSLSSAVKRHMVAFQRLRVLPSLVNQAVGDAICDLLLVDAILHLQEWNLEKWDSLYKDRPSRQLKVKVKDRTFIITNENETRVISPHRLQAALDQEIKIFQNSSLQARCFVRPSGTEDAVRVYAEASRQDFADNLAIAAKNHVRTFCGGDEDNDSKANIGKSGIRSRL